MKEKQHILTVNRPHVVKKMGETLCENIKSIHEGCQI